ncbi:MAG TPA: hypothetical protein VMF89_15090 [Polyangiales bacterium]|nr:hypothetical protein [Polyangiales bacterium]
MDSKSLLQIDPATGDRSVLSTVSDLSCGGQAITRTGSSLVAALSGDLYFSAWLGAPGAETEHILRVSPAYWSCTSVTSLSDAAQGPTDLVVSELVLSEQQDHLWMVSPTGPSLVKVRLDDSTRALVSGTSLGAGETAMLPRSDELWTANLTGGQMTSLDLESGATTTRPIAGPLRKISKIVQLRLMKLPDTDLLLISTGLGLFLYDPNTGMSNMAAWR